MDFAALIDRVVTVRGIAGNATPWAVVPARNSPGSYTSKASSIGIQMITARPWR
jgi:hypothetical protein